MSGAVTWLVATAAGLGLAAVAYVGARSTGPAGFAAALLRWAAATILVALLLDAPVGAADRIAPVVALDVSRSWRRLPDAAWDSARESAAGRDSLLLFGDSARVSADLPSEPLDAASRIAPLVDRAVAAGRPLLVVTDGRIDDPNSLARLPLGSRVEVVEHDEQPDLAIVSLDAPRAAVTGDTLDLRVTVASGGAGSSERRLTLSLAGETVTIPAAPLEPYAEREIAVRVPVRSEDGAAVLLAVLHDASGTPVSGAPASGAPASGAPASGAPASGAPASGAPASGDAVPANDTLASVLEVSPAAGAVLVSTSPDYDVRGLLGVLRGTTQLPTRAYLRVAPGEWRQEGTLAEVSESSVRAASREAPLVVLHGDTAVFGPPGSATRGALLLMPTPPELALREWYPTGAPASPIAGALTGLPWDSLPPLSVARDPGSAGWRGLELRRNRGAERSSPVAGSDGPPRRAVVAAAGFWRWEFRGGVGTDAFRAFWGGLLDWLAAERVDPRRVLPDEPPIRAGEQVRWRRVGGTDSVVRVSLRREGGIGGAPAPDADTSDAELLVRFAPGEAVALTPPLPEGRWRVRTPGGEALLLVNPARELLPRRPVVESGEVGASPVVQPRPGARSVGWLYLLAVIALCAEWLLRRRAGLR